MQITISYSKTYGKLADKITSIFQANQAFFHDYLGNNYSFQSGVLYFRSSKILLVWEFRYRNLIYHSDRSMDRFLPVCIKQEPLNPLRNYGETFFPADARCASSRFFLPWEKQF